MRSFVAIDIDESFKEAALAVIDELRRRQHGDKVRWVESDKLHLTLKFLGNNDADQVVALANQLPAILAKVKAFTMTVGKVVSFPSVRPHVIAILFSVSTEYVDLFNLVEQQAVTNGFAPERRSLLIHLTLGRVKTKAIPTLADIPIQLPQTLLVNQLSLYRSELNSEGSIYTRLTQVSLRN
ncbi:MAG TPA: RNA 2',3'-cyclic phosphodiesterase [Gammaproteobacteria bacterium]|nr:RNA 2',3'-cyclic phosphodiesterase [Gammaproteobacteria bacterium]